MARAKLGGCKTHLKGKLGDTIHRVVRSKTGKLISTSYAVPAARIDNNTDAQVKARMIMGQIERMFHVLPDIIKNAFINIDAGTLSFQHFARLNYPLLVTDYENHYDLNPNFDWRAKYDVTAPAGEWILSDGNLPSLNYDQLLFYQTTNNGVEVNVNNAGRCLTIGQLLDYMNLQEGDTLVFFLFRKEVTFEQPHIFQVVYHVATSLDRECLIDDTLENDIIIPEDDTNSGSIVYNEDGHFSIWWEDTWATTPYMCSCFAPLIIRQVKEKQLFSSATFSWGTEITALQYTRNAPNDVVESWKDL